MRVCSLFFALVFCLHLGAVPRALGNSSVGTVSGQFLKMGGSARATGMGEAFSAVANDSEAISWNPAGLGFAGQSSVTLMHAIYLRSLRYNYASYSRRMRAGSWATSLQYFDSNAIDQTDAAGNRQGSFKLSEGALSLGYGRTFMDLLDGRLATGLAVKWVHTSIVESAQTGAMDGGILWQPSVKSRIGFAVQNLFGKLNYKSNAANLPLNLKLGSAYRFTDSLLGSLDVNVPKDNRPNVSVGGEYKKMFAAAMAFAVRAGYHSRAGSGLGGGSSISLGAGLARKKNGFDFAWVPFEALGSVYRISVSYSFGGEAAQPKQKSEPLQPKNALKARAGTVQKAPLPHLEAKVADPLPAHDPIPKAPALATPEPDTIQSNPIPPAEAASLPTPPPLHAAPDRLSQQAPGPIHPSVSAPKKSKKDDSEWKKIALWKKNLKEKKTELGLSIAEAPKATDHLERDYREAARLLETRRLDEAVAAWRRLLNAAPDYMDASERLAATLMARAIRNSFRGNHLLAVRDFEEALKLTPNDENLKMFLRDERSLYRKNYGGR